MKDEDPDPRLFRKLVKAVVEGVLTALVFGTAVIAAASLIGLRDALAGPHTSWIIAGCGALGLFLSGRLTLEAFDDR